MSKKVQVQEPIGSSFKNLSFDCLRPPAKAVDKNQQMALCLDLNHLQLCIHGVQSKVPIWSRQDPANLNRNLKLNLYEQVGADMTAQTGEVWDVDRVRLMWKKVRSRYCLVHKNMLDVDGQDLIIYKISRMSMRTLTILKCADFLRYHCLHTDGRRNLDLLVVVNNELEYRRLNPRRPRPHPRRPRVRGQRPLAQRQRPRRGPRRLRRAGLLAPRQRLIEIV
ncbi:hypothetical protein QAD02_000187 [Eretmocerus hayati]|uniref:Uncharacterized protein n=2 Tax=Eretmocerus hayati TaxID=131215 RepID=A0ACC2NDS4_9HYME|nr:hypothetical protein QAD02_000187 [Eretmocerus hayati]